MEIAEILMILCVVVFLLFIYKHSQKKPLYKTAENCESKEPDTDNKGVSVETYEPDKEIKETIEEITYIKDGKTGKGTMKRMTQGLQVFDENGNIIVDLTTRLPKILGEVPLISGIGEIVDKRLEGMKAWVCFKRNTKKTIGEDFMIYEVDSCVPYVKRDGNKLSWIKNAPYFYRDQSIKSDEFLNEYANQVDIVMIYGVY